MATFQGMQPLDLEVRLVSVPLAQFPVVRHTFWEMPGTEQVHRIRWFQTPAAQTVQPPLPCPPQSSESLTSADGAANRAGWGQGWRREGPRACGQWSWPGPSQSSRALVSCVVLVHSATGPSPRAVLSGFHRTRGKQVGGWSGAEPGLGSPKSDFGGCALGHLETPGNRVTEHLPLASHRQCIAKAAWCASPSWTSLHGHTWQRPESEVAAGTNVSSLSPGCVCTSQISSPAPPRPAVGMAPLG